MRALNVLSKLVNAIVTVIELILIIRFILIALQVKASSPFITWLYITSAPLAAPFKGIFQNLEFKGFVFDFSSLFALIAYSIVGIILAKLIAHPTKV